MTTNEDMHAFFDRLDRIVSDFELLTEKVARLHGRLRRLEARVASVERDRYTRVPKENDDHD